MSSAVFFIYPVLSTFVQNPSGTLKSLGFFFEKANSSKKNSSYTLTKIQRYIGPNKATNACTLINVWLSKALFSSRRKKALLWGLGPCFFLKLKWTLTYTTSKKVLYRYSHIQLVVATCCIHTSLAKLEQCMYKIHKAFACMLALRQNKNISMSITNEINL